jgi:hypothetical protein
MNKRLKVPPKFPGEAAERAFWEKNDSTAYVAGPPPDNQFPD